LPALQHRVLLGFEADAERIQVRDLTQSWLERAERRSK